MKVALLGKKIGMTRIFREEGSVIPVTVLEVAPSVITQVKTLEKDGYTALQLGYANQKEQRISKSKRGLFAKIAVPCKRFLYEVRSEKELEGLTPGDQIGIENFEIGDYVDVTGVSIGKGFQGAVKRHHFKGAKSFSHGDMSRKRTGSIGASAFPSRVLKGMKGPGRMGGRQVTVQNLPVVDIDLEHNLVLLEGAVPGSRNNMVRISVALKRGKAKELKIRKASSLETANAESPAPAPQASSEESKSS